MPDVSWGQDGELFVKWPGILLRFDEEGFGYAVMVNGQYVPGKFEDWPQASADMQRVIANPL